MSTQKAKEEGLKALPYLIRAAQQRKVLTYKEISSLIGVHFRAARHFLGFIRDEICLPRGLPLLNVIVVNTDSKIPGDSFTPNGVKNLDKNEKVNIFENKRDEVFKYGNKWNLLLSELGIKPIKATPEELINEATEYNKFFKRTGFDKKGESEEHRLLKEFVSKNPQKFGLSKHNEVTPEYQFPSDDRCDLLFDFRNNKYAIVEIKQGHRGELVKGIFQIVKYRALLEAQKINTLESIESLLVAYEIPEEISLFANSLSIKCFQIDKEYIF